MKTKHKPKPHGQQYKPIGFYPGKDLREDTAALFKVLRNRGTSFSEVIRPWLIEMIAKNAEEIYAVKNIS